MDNICEVCRIHSVFGIRTGANMANDRQKLTWIGNDEQPRLEHSPGRDFGDGG